MVFDQYLRTTDIPTLELTMVQKKKGKDHEHQIQYRWTNCVEGFDLPLLVQLESGKWSWIYPTTERQTAPCALKSLSDFSVDKRLYVKVKK